MNYTEADLQKQIKPLSENAFVAFFQRIVRWWLSIWYSFAEKHPKLSKIIYMVFFFIVFSEGVTIFQFVVMTFLPYAFPESVFAHVAVGWPGVAVGSLTDNGALYVIFGDNNGWGYFIAFEIAVFLAQCINFPLQRNITYRSHGNPWYQAMWYFIGWVLVSIFTNAVWGILNVFFTHWGWYLKGAESLATLAGLIKTVLTGGVSMVIFFFIFLLIFPDNEKVAKRARAKYEKLVASNAPAEKVEAAKAKAEAAEKAAELSRTEKAAAQATSLASAKAMQYFAYKKNVEAGKAGENPEATLEEKFNLAAKAIDDKVAAVAAYEQAKA